MEVHIKKLCDTQFTMYDVHNLIKEVYSKRAEDGIHFQALYKTTEDLEKRIKDHSGIVFVATDQHEKTLLGTGTILFDIDKNHIPYAGLVLAAVQPNAQGCGIGKLLRQRREEFAKENGCVYVSSSTAEKAKSSVEYHLRTGSKKYGYYSSPNSDYYSIYFRKYFRKTIQGSAFYCYVRYNLSRIAIKSLFHENGGRKPLGDLCFYLINIIKGRKSR